MMRLLIPVKWDWVIFGTVLLLVTFYHTIRIPELSRWFVAFMVLAAVKWVYLWIATWQEWCPWCNDEDYPND